MSRRHGGLRTASGHRLGEWHQRAKLSDDAVRCMREVRYHLGLGYRRLARMFQCGESTVRDIVTFRTRSSA